MGKIKENQEKGGIEMIGIIMQETGEEIQIGPMKEIIVHMGKEILCSMEKVKIVSYQH